MLVTGDANFVGLGATATLNPNGTVSSFVDDGSALSQSSIVSGFPDWIIYVAGAVALFFFTKKVSK